MQKVYRANIRYRHYYRTLKFVDPVPFPHIVLTKSDLSQNCRKMNNRNIITLSDGYVIIGTGRGSLNVQILPQVHGVDEDSMEHLLHCCLWSTDSLIQHYLDHPASLCREVGLSGEPAIPPPTKGAKLSCPICLLNVPTTDMLWLWCNHACCKVT